MSVLLRIILIAFLLLSVAPWVSADTADVDKTIVELQLKITQLQSQHSSLQKEITLKDSQIKLTSLRIDDAQAKITLLDKEIGNLNDEIEKLEELKTRQLELVRHRIPQSYKRAKVTQFGWMLFSNNFSDLITKTKYLMHVQEQEALHYQQIELTQQNFNESKDRREKKKAEQEAERAKLEKYTLDLAKQKKEKQIVLAETQNSETVYQRLLAQALAERQALEKALVDSVKVGPVKKGHPIALVGNSGYPGCSTGAHLHFEVRKGGTWVDPGSYLSSKSVSDQQNGGSWTTGSGSWDWPLSDTVQMTQHFGKTPWSYRYSYSGGIHTGYDMTSTGGSVIRAPADGELYSSSQNCGSSSVIKIKYIDHGDGVLSFYLHVQ